MKHIDCSQIEQGVPVQWERHIWTGGPFWHSPTFSELVWLCECKFIFQHCWYFCRHFKSQTKVAKQSGRSAAVGMNTSFFFPLMKSRDVSSAVALFCRADDETAAVWKFVSCVGYKLVLYIWHLFVLRTGWLSRFLYAWLLGSRITLVSCAK